MYTYVNISSNFIASLFKLKKNCYCNKKKETTDLYSNDNKVPITILIM